MNTIGVLGQVAAGLRGVRGVVEADAEDGARARPGASSVTSASAKRGAVGGPRHRTQQVPDRDVRLVGDDRLAADLARAGLAGSGSTKVASRTGATLQRHPPDDR